MRRTSALFPVLVAVVLAVGTVHAQEAPSPSPSVSPSASAGASASPSPAASASAVPLGLTDPCDLWTPEEVSAALGGGDFTVRPEMAGPATCGYEGTKKAGDLTQGLAAGIAFGDASTGSLLDLVRQNFPESEELDLGGVIAIPGTTYPGAGKAKGWSMASAYLFPDPMTMVQVQATAPKGVDAAAALVALVALAAPRVATIQQPAASPSPSASPAASGSPGASPSGVPATGLAALFPTEIGGEPTSIERDLTGQEFLAQIIDFKPMEQRVTKALRQRDKKVGDLRFIIGSTDNGSIIAAFQVDGTPIRPLVNTLLGSLDMQRTGEAVQAASVAGKDAFEVTGGFLIGTSGVAYAKDDVLWLIFSFGEEQSEIFAALP